uniref:Uncharacterized protein n=1 Tax=Anguilla anguilla TaxID=7936 RepID=A0A0E9S8Z2_ANGAN
MLNCWAVCSELKTALFCGLKCHVCTLISTIYLFILFIYIILK